MVRPVEVHGVQVYELVRRSVLVQVRTGEKQFITPKVRWRRSSDRRR